VVRKLVFVVVIRVQGEDVDWFGWIGGGVLGFAEEGKGP
jgi:hypothetical protein